MNILNYLKEHDPDDVNNIIRIKDYSVFRKHLIISFELLSINLYEFIKNNFSGASKPGENSLVNGAAGVFATLLHDAVMVPSDGKFLFSFGLSINLR